MKKITLPSGEYLMVEVDSESKNFTLIESHSYFKSPRIEHSTGGIDLPSKDNYTLIGLCSEISEEEANGIVETDSKTISTGEKKILLSGFKDYKRVGGSSVFTVYKNPTESLASLVRSNGMEVDTAVLLKIKN